MLIYLFSSLKETAAYESKLAALQKELKARSQAVAELTAQLRETTARLESTRQGANLFEAQVQRLSSRLSDLDSRAATDEGEVTNHIKLPGGTHAHTHTHTHTRVRVCSF